MSRISDLRNNPKYSINFIDIIKLLCLNGETKYVETLLRIVKNTKNLDTFAKESVEVLSNDYGMDKSVLTSTYDDLQILFIRKFVEDVFNLDDLKMYRLFCEYNEQNIIEMNDLSRYNRFDDIDKVVTATKSRIEMKKLEKQVHKIYEDDEWLVVKPLTFEASKKYGSSTKWCTTTEGDPSQFNNYSAGILIYVINKVNNLKVAVNKKDSKTTFWAANDTSVDSIESGLPIEIIKVIKEDIEKNKRSNAELSKTIER